MKECSTCKVSKSEELFYKDNRTRDNLYSNCKECAKKASRKNFLKNNRRYERTDRMREYARNYMKRYGKSDKARLAIKARVLVNKALKTGELTKLSCHCGSESTQAHHDDYNFPLKVVWVCKQHHEDIHHKLI